MIKLKAFFKNISEQEKRSFQNKKCLISISVGQQSHDSVWLNASLQLISKHFKSCIVLVDDVLQRYTMSIIGNKSPDFYYPHSLEEGDAWLKRNQEILASLPNLEKIERWEHWLKKDCFEKRKTQLLEKMTQDANYNNVFIQSVDEFVNKMIQRNIIDKNNLLASKKASFEFVLEECTALTYWTELECEYEAYPGPHNLAMQATKELFVFTKQPNLLTPLCIGFRNSPQLEPQKFDCFNLVSNTQTFKLETA